MMKFVHATRFLFIAALFALAAVPGVVRGQRNLDVCHVTTHTRSLSQGYGTGIYGVGKFPVDSFEDGAQKTYRYERDGLSYDIKAEVEYGDWADVERGKPANIVLSLLVKLSDGRGAVSTPTPVKAGATYRHKWGTAYVSADVVTGDTVQQFRLTCSDGLSKNGVRRDRP